MRKGKLLAVILAAAVVGTCITGCGAESQAAAGQEKDTSNAKTVQMINGKDLTQVGFSAPAMDNEFQTNLSSNPGSGLQRERDKIYGIRGSAVRGETGRTDREHGNHGV